MGEILKVLSSLTPLTTTSVRITGTTDTSLNVSYSTLPGNQPNTYGNAIFLWQNTNTIPYNQQPIASAPIPGNTQSGSVGFSGLTLQIKSYILGYAVGPNVSQICSTAYLPASGTSSDTFQTSLSILSLETDSAIIGYSTPVGNLPKSNKNWIGLWQGEAPSYTVAPMSRADVSDNATSSTTIAATFRRSTTYTIAYFTSEKQTAMAASYTFST